MAADSDAPVAMSITSQLDVMDGQQALRLSRLSPKLRMTIASPPATTFQVACQGGRAYSMSVQCPSYPGVPPASVVAECSGRSRSVAVTCPAPPATCVFWNETSRSWSTQGVTTNRAASGEARTCESTHASEYAGKWLP